MYNVKTVMVHQQKQYKFYSHNLSSLFQYLCITLVIKKLYAFESSTLDDCLILLILNRSSEGGREIFIKQPVSKCR